MRISTKITIDIETGAELLRDSYEYIGPIDLACGSGNLASLEASQTAAANTIHSDAQQVFQGNQNILQSLTDNFTSMLKSGQFGFTPQEEAALRSGSMENIAAAGRQASGKTGEEIAAIGGGNSVLPSGSKDAILGQQAEQTALAQAQSQQAITEKGYDVGRQQQEFAGQLLAQAPGELENPATQMFNSATGASELATNTENQRIQATRAWIAPVTSLLTAGIGAGGQVGAAELKSGTSGDTSTAS
jgi:hypothetical protein